MNPDNKNRLKGPRSSQSAVRRQQPPAANPLQDRITPDLRPEPAPAADAAAITVQIALAPASPPPPDPAAPAEPPSGPVPEDDTIPARMLNEFVYCPRLFYYEHVEGVFLHNADTLRGSAIHQRVDSGSGAMPAARRRIASAEKSENSAEAPTKEPAPAPPPAEPEVIHSRSVTMGSERLRVVAKMDLVECRPAATASPATNSSGEHSSEDLFNLEVCPVDYKAGAPKENTDPNADSDALQLWDSDKMQLGLQAIILRENGYNCREGIIYYRATKQRVRLQITPELIAWVESQVAEARRVAAGPIPPPLVNSPKCVRCSLAPVCLPDETSLLGRTNDSPAEEDPQNPPPADSNPNTAATPPRRIIAARDDVRALYLNTPGLRVGVTSDTLQIKENDGPRSSRIIDQVRIRDLNHVALFGNIQISTQAVQTLCDHEIPITYFSMSGGRFYGITRGHELKNVFLRKKQFRAADDPGLSLQLARQIVSGKIRNHRTLLRRNHIELPDIPYRRLKVLAENALRAPTIQELLGIEGAAAALYFENFNGMLKAGDDLAEDAEADASGQMRFSFENRTRRPPTDPVNALLSFAYSILTKDATIAVCAVGFDPYIGFYHQPRFGRPALALDLMEEFRPLIAESAVLSAVNNRVITQNDFIRAGKAVNLTPAGRKKFIQTYEQRINDLIAHPVFDYKVSYRRALELQGRILAKCLTGEIPQYIPFTTR